MASCYSCNEILNNKNRSEEHILPNAIGGQRSSYRLLCHSCNKRLGEEVDIALSQTGAPYAHKLQIKRDRGSIPEFVDAEVDAHILMRAVCKVVVNYYIDRTKDRSAIQSVIQFIKDGGEHIYCKRHHLYVNKQYSDQPHHIIVIAGDTTQRTLRGYFELFGVMGFVVMLNDNYTGARLDLCYVLNPVTWDEPDWELNVVPDVLQGIRNTP